MMPGSVANSWKAEWGRLRQALTLRYGAERTADILAGRDEKTNIDLAKWRVLGRSPG